MRNNYSNPHEKETSLRKCVRIAICIIVVCTGNMASAQTPVPVVSDAVQDAFVAAAYTDGQFSGYLGKRMDANQQRRLLALDLESILDPFRNRGTYQAWAGEYVGKYLHAASLTWEMAGNTALKTKIDYAASELIKTQLADGYLGTYQLARRWTEWDVWAHKYSILGLLEYHRVTGNAAALAAAGKAADLLVTTFGTGPGQRDIIASGTHVGMAPTSVLEPMVMLYRFTGKAEYLAFCNYLISSWNQANGPHIITDLLAGKGVNQIANGKAYEMLSCIVGLAEMYRLTGNADYLTACKNAWQDIKTKRSYIIGSSSYDEHFHGDFSLRIDSPRADSGPAEGCVSVTWLQLSWQLLRLTGEAKYSEELERIAFNSLTAAQNPRDGKICYHIALDRDKKDYGAINHGIQPDICCCSFSIPRGIALIPKLITGSLAGDLAVGMYVPGSYSVPLPGKAGTVNYKIKTLYPESGAVAMEINPTASAQFKVRLRVPSWATNFHAFAKNIDHVGVAGSWLDIDETWNAGDTVTIRMDMPVRIENNPDTSYSSVSISRGPQVLALDEGVVTPSGLPAGWVGKQVYKIKTSTGEKTMVPYADAGQLGNFCQLYIPPCALAEYSPTELLTAYQSDLTRFRAEYGGTRNNPDVAFYLFGMGSRPKLVYKNGSLINALTSAVVASWNVSSQTIVPSEYAVEIVDAGGNKIRIYEDEIGIWIRTNAAEALVEGSRSWVTLPKFSHHAYGSVLRVLHQELLINIVNSEPVPNFLVYSKAWRRDAAMMAMCFDKTDNVHLIKTWLLGLTDPYDKNNSGNSEPDNLGQDLYMMSLVADKNHPFVQTVLAAIPPVTVTNPNGQKHITGSVDFSQRSVYPTKWLKYGLRALGLPDPYTIPAQNDSYAALFWMDYKEYNQGTEAADRGNYPYLGWAVDHFHGTKLSPISNRDYPLTWERNASNANYAGMAVVDPVFVSERLSVPHTWHAAEVFLYTLASNPGSGVDADTDGDGLLDVVETSTGSYVSPVNTGSNPLVADSDGDGINDGLEVSMNDGYITDPNHEDTDGDFISDFAEINDGTDPTDANSPGMGSSRIIVSTTPAGTGTVTLSTLPRVRGWAKFLTESSIYSGTSTPGSASDWSPAVVRGGVTIGFNSSNWRITNGNRGTGMNRERNYPVGFSWTGGDTQVNGTNDNAKAQLQKSVGDTLSFSVPMDADASRTLILWLGQYTCNTTLTVRGHDSAGVPISDAYYSGTYASGSGLDKQQKVQIRFKEVHHIDVTFVNAGNFGINQDWAGPQVAAAALTGTAPPPVSDYNNWTINYPGHDLSNPAGDNDGDGMKNQEEYAFGLDPTKGSSVNPITAPLNGSAFSYQRRSTTGLDYKVYFSTNLINWPEDAGATQTSSTPDGNGVKTVAVQLSGTVVPENGKLFIRVGAK